MFDDFDLRNFWEESEYADRDYVDDPVTPEKIALAERTLGFKLPAAYLALMKSQNGGTPRSTNHRTTTPTSWAHDHVAISCIYSIGNARPSSLCGAFSSQFWIDEWGYPPIGVYFADCPSWSRHALPDYRGCGPGGEPSAVHVDQEFDYRITFVAPDFESFVRGLEDDDAFE